MQTAKVLVNIGGDSGNQVPKVVTAAEIAVLMAIHGDDAVTNIDPAEDIERTNRDELDRLRGIYGRATDGENNRVIDKLYPGAGARVFETLGELNLSETFYKPTSRASAKPAAPEPVEADKKPARKAKKAEAEAAPETSVPADDESDGVKEMADGDKLFA